MAREFNFDGLVGPSHNYGGLAFGNVASQKNEGSRSSPRQAALQGVQKMRTLHKMGVAQAVLPPHMRPDLRLARRLGFVGDDAQVLNTLAKQAPILLAACYSASAMWTANAGTVSPSADSADGRLHFTPANLQNKLHRSIEAETTTRIMQAIFEDGERFCVHEALPATAALGDEGAANHTRLAPRHGDKGVQLFVYGESAANAAAPRPRVYPARQTLEACQSLARLHQVPAEQRVIAQQNPEVIDQGVFHNDVIAVGNGGLLFHHAQAFLPGADTVREVADKYEALTGQALVSVEVPTEAVPIADAVSSYLFNSQLLTLPGGRCALIAPIECQENPRVQAYVQSLIEGEAPIHEVHHFDLRQSMRGGGGPACLRLRVVLTEDEAAALPPGVFFSPQLDARLVAWIDKHYRDELRPEDLADPALLTESQVALDELSQLLGLPSIYPFQL